MKKKLYRVRFKRPDGTEAWLGPPCGGAKTEEKESPAMPRSEAAFLADERNRFYGTSGFRYWAVPVTD